MLRRDANERLSRELGSIAVFDDFFAEYGHEITPNQATMREVGA